MPDRDGDENPRLGSCGSYHQERRSTSEGMTSLIPLPRSGQFSSAQQRDSKLAKTEKNRLKLILQNCDEEVAVEDKVPDKESRIIGGSTDHSENRDAVKICAVDDDKKRVKKTTIPRYRPNLLYAPNQKEAVPNLGQPETSEPTADKDECRDLADKQHHRQQQLGGVSARVGVEGSKRSSCNSPSRRPYQQAAAALTGGDDVDGVTRPTYPQCLEEEAPVVPRLNGAKILGEHLASSSRRRGKDDVMDPDVRSEDDYAKSGFSSPELFSKRIRNYENVASSDDDSRPGSSLQNQRLLHYHGAWPGQRDRWGSMQSTGFPAYQSGPATAHGDMDGLTCYSAGMGTNPTTCMQDQRRLGSKVDVVYSLLGMLGTTEGREDMSVSLLSMSNSLESCLAMRQSGCLPLLIQLIHAPGQDPETRERAARALHNVIHARSDERAGRREARVLRLLEQLRDYCQMLRASLETGQPLDDLERHPGATIAALMKLSFDEAHRHAMCQLGALHAVAELIEMDHAAHGSDCEDQNCITLRRYAGMALTNLTFGDGNNKALLCSFLEFMKALVSQLRSFSDDLRQVTASVLRNLSWRADSSSKQTLREVGAVIGLMCAAMEGRKESTLKSILSALWNLSAHCSTNKMDICAVEGALAFLVDMLSYEAPSKTLAIVENAGGILRNVSSHIAVREDYREIVRERGCLQVLLRQLRSPSLTVVSNSCGALWNLSARCPQDQRLLWDLGAVPMLRSLVHSKHKMISMGSSAALKNLLSARPSGSNLVHLDSTARGLGLSTLPTLGARKQKALEQEIDQNLAETCENIEPSTSPINKDDKFDRFTFKLDQSFTDMKRSYHVRNSQPGPSGTRYGGVTRSESRESMRSVTSTHSDTIFEKVHRIAVNGLSLAEIKQQSLSLHSATGGFDMETDNKGSQTEKKYALKYMNAIPERLKSGEDSNGLGNSKCNVSTISWAAEPNQDITCSKTMIRSVLDDASMTSSCESSASKVGNFQTQNLMNVAANFSNTRIKPNLSFDNISSYNSSLKNIQKAISPSLSPEGDLFGDYAETDLDQPTDYSLRYAEQVSDEDEKQSSAYFTSNEQDLIQSEDTVKTYCTEGTPYQISQNSSRATSASDLQDDSKIRSTFKKIPEPTSRLVQLNGAKHFNNGFTIGEKSKLRVPSKTRSNGDVQRTTKLEDVHSSLDIESSMEIDDSAIFIEEGMFGQSSGTPSLGSITGDDEPKITNDSKRKEQRKNGSTQNVEVYSVDAESCPESMHQVSDGDDDDEDLLVACINIGMQNNRHRQSYRRNSFDEDSPTESNLTRYKTSNALNNVAISSPREMSDGVVSGAESSPLTSLEYVSPQNARSDGDFSTATYTNVVTCCSEISEASSIDNGPCEFYTVHETITIEKDISKMDRDEEESLSTDSHPFSSTQSYMSVDDKELRLDTDRTLDSAKSKVKEVPNSESCESFDSVERSEHALLELCIKSEKLEASEDVKQNVPEKGAKRIEEAEYRRQRDPDAMIASLDRLTATLVQQTEAMRERESSITMKQSLLSDTWNEDSPNEFSCPSISVSAPYVASFKSEEDENTVPSAESSPEHENGVHAVLSQSTIIEREAFKLAEAVRQEANEHDTGSFGISLDLDSINPPSTMGSLLSLTASLSAVVDTYDGIGKSLPLSRSSSRKKSLPLGVVAKRALGQNYTGSLESLLMDCGNHSQLENVKPPSMMDELLDMGDMENSMVSVASITSEIADAKDNDSSSDLMHEMVKPVANVLAITYMRYAEGLHGSANNSLTECLENINPPSLFNEVSQMDDSTMDANTDTVCSETLCHDMEFFSEEVSHHVLPERIEEMDNDTDEATTPIPSEYCASSSAESTPKKRLHKSHLTPKQKRQLTKERYKTYTIAAEMVKKDEDRKKEQAESEVTVQRGKCSPFSKLTPVQRRQEDRARFQTQVLDISNLNKDTETRLDNQDLEKPETVAPKSSIPMLKKVSSCKVYKTNRTDKERYRTRTLNEVKLTQITTEEATSSNGLQEMHCMLEQNANIVLDTLNETKNGQICDDALLDCETLSLVSNESDAERSLQLRFVHGVSQRLYNDCPERLVMKNFEPDINSQRRSSDSKLSSLEGKNSSEYSSDSEDDSLSDKQPQQIRGPRIIKPTAFVKELEPNLPDTEPKGIRGKRKPLYSNPTTRKSTPQSSPLKVINATGIPIGRSNTSPIVRGTRATALRQNNNTFQKANSTPKISTTPTATERKISSANLAKRSSIPQKSTTGTYTKAFKRHSTPPSGSATPQKENKVESPVKPLERQGTFTKIEPKMENAPTIQPASPSNSKLSRPTKFSPKTSPVHNGKSKISVRSYQSTPMSKLPKSADLPSPKGIPTLRRPTTGFQFAEQRTVTPAKKVTKDAATSKISNLWKKVEESKMKQRFTKPDTRKWITSEPAEATDSAEPYRLMRSSTFEGISSDMDVTFNQRTDCQNEDTSKFRNSCDLSEMKCKIPVKFNDSREMNGHGGVTYRKQQESGGSETDPAKRISRLGSFFRVDSSESEGTSTGSRTPASAIVAPYNYVPHRDIQSADSKIEGEFRKEIITSLTRVTTV